MPKRQLVLVKHADPERDPEPLGSFDDIAKALADYNTAPDGAPPSGPTRSLYGPGMIVEINTTQPRVNQALVTVIEEDMAWPVLSRLCRRLAWKLQDINSGQVFG
ncbi:MAG: hypothetical protein KDA05_07750 [Phycisphaerales bacterium]|nr:hypothetical protein [Phycisphaerales bacterium]MCB9840337.1 hypothetical protein [Phycisphaeraceae bacterium]